MPNQRSQLEATFLSRLQDNPVPMAPLAEQGELAGRRRDPSLFSLALSRIRPDEDQVRRFSKNASDPSIQELAESIKAVGVLQPIDVRYVREGDFYEIVAGERRFTAAGLADLSEIPVKLLDASEAEVRRLQILENIHRQELSPLELGTALEELIKDGATPEELSTLLCKTTSYVTKALGIARNLSPQAKQMIQNAPADFGGMAHLYEVSLLPADQQQPVLARIAEERLTRQDLQTITTEIKRKTVAARPSKAGRPRKATTLTKVITLANGRVIIHLNQPQATNEELAAVLRVAIDTLA